MYIYVYMCFNYNDDGEYQLTMDSTVYMAVR